MNLYQLRFLVLPALSLFLLSACSPDTKEFSVESLLNPEQLRHYVDDFNAGHHFYEGRWLHDTQYLDNYARFWFRKGGSPRRYSFWSADAIYHYYLTAMANVLNIYPQEVISKSDYFDLLQTYSKSHRRINDTGATIHWKLIHWYRKTHGIGSVWIIFFTPEQ